MTSSEKQELERLLTKKDLLSVFRELSQYFRHSRSDLKDRHDKMLLQWGRFNTLKEQRSNEEISQEYFDGQCDTISIDLQNIIDHIPLDEQSQRPRNTSSRPSKPASRGGKVTSKPPKTKISAPSLGDIIERIKQIPSKLWGSAKKSEAQPKENVDTKVYRRMERMDEEDKKNYEPEDASSSPELEETASSEMPEEVGFDEDLETISPVRQPPVSSPTPSPAPATPTSSPFQKGKILYAIPGQMCIGKASRCKVRIAPDQIPTDEIESGLSDKEKETATNESIKITQIMKVELVEANDLDNFDISTRNTIEQPILPFGFTEWTFDVTAKRPGHYALLLRVSAKINIPGYGERAYDVAILDRAILVSTSDQPVDENVFTEQSIPDPDWDEGDEQAVLHSIEQGCMDEAIERIANFVQDKDRDFHTELILLHSRWNDNTNQLTNKLISAADWDIVNNKVRFAITQLLDQLKVSFPPDAAGKVMDWKGEKEKLVANVGD